MKPFTPCKGKSDCRDDGKNCLVCGRSLQEIEDTRRLIDELAGLAIAYEYENVGEFAAYVASKVVKKVAHQRKDKGS
jgi:hypothetical protein